MGFIILLLVLIVGALVAYSSCAIASGEDKLKELEEADRGEELGE